MSFYDRLLAVVCPSVHPSDVHLSICKLFTFSSSSQEPISTKLGTKHPWVNEIKICYNKGPYPFKLHSEGYIFEISGAYFKITYLMTNQSLFDLQTQILLKKNHSLCYFTMTPNENSYII